MYRIAVASLIAVCAAPLIGQDIMYYKFEEGGGSNVINFATDDPSIPREASIATAPGVATSDAWGTGKFGGGLAAAPFFPTVGSHVETGWDCAIFGSDLTIGMFIRLVHPLPSNDSAVVLNRYYGMNSSRGVRITLIGVAGPDYGYLRFGWATSSGNGRNVTLAQNLIPSLSADWVHIAIVIHRTGSFPYYARWFINGVPQAPEQINPSDFQDIFPQWFGAPNRSFTIGDNSRGYLAMDEVRVSLREAPPSEILEWATASEVAQAPYGAPCHPFGTVALLDGTSGGLPIIGNPNYRLTTYGLPGSTVFLGIGTNNQQFSGMPLPLDLGASFPSLQGCFLRTSADLLVVQTQIGPTGSVDVLLPIPAVPTLDGVVVYSQALLGSQILGTLMVTNAYASAIGQ